MDVNSLALCTFPFYVLQFNTFPPFGVRSYSRLQAYFSQNKYYYIIIIDTVIKHVLELNLTSIGFNQCLFNYLIIRIAIKLVVGSDLTLDTNTRLITVQIIIA